MSGDSNKKKTDLLGMNHGTASHQLRKLILFKLVVSTGLDICHRCGKRIISVSDLSIEHKEPWMQAEDPKESFFDLDNIAFSHLSCNVSAAARPLKKYFTEEEKKAANAEYDRRKWYKLPKEERQRRRRVKYEKHGF